MKNMVRKIDGRKMCNLCAGLDPLNAYSAPARVEAQQLAASPEVPVQLSARHLTLDGDRQIGLDGVARGVDAKPDGGIEGNLDPSAGAVNVESRLRWDLHFEVNLGPSPFDRRKEVTTPAPGRHGHRAGVLPVREPQEVVEVPAL